MTLDEQPERRSMDYELLIHLLDPARDVSESPVIETPLQPPAEDFQLSEIASISSHLPFKAILPKDAALQLSLCYKIGFGAVKDDSKAERILVANYPDNEGPELLAKLMGDLKKLPLVRQNTQTLFSELGLQKCIELNFWQYSYERIQVLRAEPWIKQEIQDLLASFGNSHTLTKIARLSLATILTLQGKWKEAKELEAQAMETHERVLGNEHPSTPASLANLASTYRYQGRWSQAEELDIQVVETRKRILGEEHPATLASISSLASAFRNQGRWSQAEELDMQAVETRRKILGEKHPDTLASISSLALTFRNQGRLSQAEELDKQVVETRTKTLGEEHPDTLASISSLALTFKNQGRWSQAEELGMRVIQTRKRVLGEEHPDTLTSIDILKSIYRHQGKWRDAEGLHQVVSGSVESRREDLLSQSLQNRNSADPDAASDVSDVSSIWLKVLPVDSASTTYSAPNINQEASEQLAEAICNDLDLYALYKEGASKYEKTKLLKNSDKLLKKLFKSFRKIASSNHHLATIRIL
ncbi:MAG: hypothetical protein M1822_006178 [Bathelium mastoideum]|nr:MAG: hypothetical protein M1822_006178 [Bathelium mastoideum]